MADPLETPSEPSDAFFLEGFDEQYVRGLLKLVRGERAVDDLIERLSTPEGVEWLDAGLTRVFGAGYAGFLTDWQSGRLGVAKLVEIKGASKSVHRDTRSEDERLFSLAAYFFSVAAAQAFHSAPISSRDRGVIDPILREISRVAGPRWRHVLDRAAASRQYFPRTDLRFLNRFLESGLTNDPRLLRHTLAVYHRPLAIYFRGSSFRDMGDADEYVSEFLGRNCTSLYENWLARRERDGKDIRLSAWLMSRFVFYLRECRRREQKQRKRESPSGDLLDDALAIEMDADPRRAYERALATEAVRRAINETREFLESRGDSKLWEAFIARHYEGKPYRDIATRLNIREDYARRLASHGRDRFRKIFSRFLFGEGVLPETIDSAVDDLLAAFEDAPEVPDDGSEDGS